MERSDMFTREDIKRTLIETHRDNQLLWGRWYSQATTAVAKSSLYRYREGFDAAIFFLAERFQLDLSYPGGILKCSGEEKKGNVIMIEKIDLSPGEGGIRCPHCDNLLFRKGSRLWHCPTCLVNFLAADEDD